MPWGDKVTGPINKPVVISAATATKATKGEILSTLQLGEDDIEFIEQSPNRPNLKYSVQYLDKNEALQTAFSALIGDLKNQVAKTQEPYSIVRQENSARYYFVFSRFA